MSLRETLGILTVALTVLMLVAQPVAAAETPLNPNSDSYDGVVIEANTTKATHMMGWDTVQYENDAGEITRLPGVVNDSADNPYRFTVTDINFSDAGEFPRRDCSVISSRGLTIHEAEPAPLLRTC
ncbi:hypothetical protein [Haloarcula pelagica]|nr:hypothetical protein [Halomicroarcula sp. YJ-61-S]